MSFYSDLSPWYDSVFAVGADEMAFVKSLLRGKTPLLDIGCGTGNRTEHLCAPSVTIEAVDLDPTMIARAETAHACPAGEGNIRYSVLNMTAVAEHFATASFAGALCLGNTLAHLPSADAIADFCLQARLLLQPDGLFILQTLNYDRILTKRITSLPLLDTPEATFKRGYEFREDGMHFVTELTVKSNGQTVTGDTRLYPLTRLELEKALSDAGFRKVDLYGSYGGTPWDDESFVTLAAARR